jgi:hypothetical protein
MSQQSIPLSELQSAPAAKFEEMGDSNEGRISAVEWRKQTDPKTGQVKYFSSGDPMQQLVITIDTAKGESMALYAKGGNFPAVKGEGQSMLNAIAKAAKDAGAGSIDVGADLTVTFTGEGKKEPGLNAPKLYTAKYAAAKASVPVGDLFDPNK